MVAQIIPAKLKAKQKSSDPQKLRVAAYARVSTDSEEQESSYEVQCTHYKNLISDNPAYTFVGMYADEGISGLSMKNREQFNQMLQDCRDGKIDLILTKSVSRWARNTLDSIKTIRELKSIGVEVYFEKENIRTLDASGELLLTLMSSIAQAESESISKNIQLGIKYHFQEGKVCGGHQNILGYRRTQNGRLVIIPEEADIVRRIFRLYLDGYAPRHIAEMVKGMEIREGAERSWNHTTIRYILSNPKYCGDLILQRYYTVDVLEKKRRENTGQLPQYYVENSHEPIIPKDVFYRTQAELARRSKNKERYNKEYGLGGKVICGECGSNFVRRREGKKVYYRCASKALAKGKGKFAGAGPCGSKGFQEEQLQDAVVSAMNRLPEEKIELIKLHERLIWGPLAQAEKVISSLEERIYEANQNGEEEPELEEQLAIAMEKKAEFSEKEMQVRNLLERIEAIEGAATSCSESDDFFERTRTQFAPGPVKDFSVDDVIRFVEKIVVGEKIRVEFKAGVSFEV